MIDRSRTRMSELFTLLCGCWVGFQLIMPSLAWCETAPQGIPEMVVEGRKIEEKLSGELATYGHKVEIVTREEIKAGGYTDVNQILEALVPGLYMVSKNGRGDYMRMSLNGGDNKQVNFLIDGVRINNRLYGRGYLDTLSVKMIERVEILKNGEGLFYGTDGTSGVINIITKQVSSDAHGEIGAGYGSHEASEAHGLVSDTIGKNGLLVYGSYDGWDGFVPYRDEDYDRIDDAVRKERGYDRNNLMAKYERHVDTGAGAVLKTSLLRTAVEADFMRVDEDRALNDRTEYVGILKWDHDITKDFAYYVKAYYHEWWTDYTRQELGGSFVYNEAQWGYEDWGVNVMGSWFFSGENELLFGLDYQNYWGMDEVVIIKGDNEEVYAGFFSLRPHFDFLPELKSAVGGRYNKTGGNDKFVWNASARSPLFGPVYARAALGTNFRLANASELYANEDDYRGNPDLKPEESFNVEAGVGAAYGFIEGELGYYHCKVTDRIKIGDDDVYTNTDEDVKMDTVEVQLATRPLNGISLGVSAVFTDAEEDGSDEQITDIPEYFYKGLIRYHHPSQRFGGDITCRYIGDVYGRDYDGFGAVNYGKYWVADLSTFVRFGTDLAHMLTLRIDNLFDEDYAGYGYSRATGSDGEDFLYEYRGTPFTMMLSYAYEF